MCLAPLRDFPQEIAGPEFIWPHAPGRGGDPIDLRRIPPPTAATAHFYYAVELTDGWCALTDTRTRTGFGLAFDPSILTTVWVFGAYGGWRGLYTTILEPCTGYPYDLETAIQQGTCAHLAPGARLETDVTAVLYRDLSEVHHISRGGQIDGAM